MNLQNTNDGDHLQIGRMSDPRTIGSRGVPERNTYDADTDRT